MLIRRGRFAGTLLGALLDVDDAELLERLSTSPNVREVMIEGRRGGSAIVVDEAGDGDSMMVGWRRTNGVQCSERMMVRTPEYRAVRLL